ncbi:DUF3151 domain-containing protein [Humibacter sp. RRB41]|uniref:DUF3151 domain-containing protein n=1 Tax=Humibacter sp. RRB41 TaxID=2919946 RepID=UPI001FAA37D9|nr:DUF3151 domain-containing protein [Humibacter sp. RRB41]
MTADSLLPEPEHQPETRLDAERNVVIELLDAGGETTVLKLVVARYPRSSLAWAKLSDATFDPDSPLESYAYARVGYHRGLDALRAAGWKGSGAIPWSHEPNRGVLRSLYALRRAADAIGEADEVTRLTEFLTVADPTAAAEIEASRTAPIPVHNPTPPTESIVIRGED